MKIHLYTLCWNEEVILPHFLKHYDFVDRIVVYDNQSNDRSLEILKSTPKVDVRTFDTGGQHHTGELDRIRNQAWLESKGQADFVIVCDMDEFLYHPDLPALLDEMKKCGGTLLKPQGYEMLGETPPLADENVFELYAKGVRTYSFDKCVLFDPNAIEQIAYQPGSHACEPTGRVVLFRRPQLFLLHYRHLGVDYVRQRYEACVARRSDYNRDRHLGTHYLENEQGTVQRFEKMRNKAEEVFSGEEADLSVPDDFGDYLLAAEKALGDQKWEQVISGLEYVLSYDPGHVSALAKLSIALNQSGRQMDAGHAMKQAVALDPERPNLWFALGEIAAGLHSEKVAINSYQRAIALREDFYLAHVRLADVYREFKQPKRAAQHYREAINLRPDKTRAYRGLGGLLQRGKQFEAAEKVYEAWIKHQGGDASALNGLGLVMKATGRTQLALEKFREALELAPQSLAVLNNLGSLLHIDGQREEALVYLRRALELEPENALLKTNLANTLLKLGRQDEAAALNQALVDDKGKD